MIKNNSKLIILKRKSKNCFQKKYNTNDTSADIHFDRCDQQ